MPDSLVRYDAQGTVRYMNPAFINGVAAEAHPALWRHSLNPTPTAPTSNAFQLLLDQAISSGKSAEVEMSLPNSAGELRSHFVRVIPERDHDNNITGALAIGRDVTDQNLAREQLKKEKQFVDDIINSLPGIFYLLDSQGRFLRVNHLFLEISGYSQTELEQINVLDFFENQDRQLVEERISKVFETGSAWAEAEFKTKSGEKIPYYFSGHLSNIGGTSYLVGLGVDITDRKRAEDILRINASVFETSQEGILITDSDNNIVDVNPAFTRITGHKRSEVIGRNPRLLSSGRQHKDFYIGMWESLTKHKSWRGELWNRRKSGEFYAELLSISAICNEL